MKEHVPPAALIRSRRCVGRPLWAASTAIAAAAALSACSPGSRAVGSYTLASEAPQATAAPTPYPVPPVIAYSASEPVPPPLSPTFPTIAPRRGPLAVPVFYGTYRSPIPGATITEPATYYGAQKRDPALGLAYGWAYVSFPPGHVAGEIEQPSLLRIEVKRNPLKHVMWGHLRLLESEKALQAELSGRARLDGGRVLLYVHGYNNSFSDSVLRAAQLSVDSRFQGITFAFSWPSLSKLRSYIADRDAVSTANTELKKLIRVLLATDGIEAVDIVAHSTGAEIAMLAIEGLQEDPAFVARRGLGQCILVGADVPATRFEQIRSSLARTVQGLTVYFGQKDWALLVSTFLSEPRLGREGARGADIIDITDLDDRLFDTHHAAFAERRPVLCDLFHVLRYRRAASERPHLVRFMNARGIAYYQPRDVPANCPP